MRWMGAAFCVLWMCACTSPDDDGNGRDAAGDVAVPDGMTLDEGPMPDAGQGHDTGMLTRLDAIQVRGYHRSNWYEFDSDIDPAYNDHSRPLLGAQVTAGARVFHLGFSPTYRARIPSGGAKSHWGGAYVRNALDDGDCVFLELDLDAPQAICQDIEDCFEWVVDGDPDEANRRRGQFGGVARLPTENHAPIFFLIETQDGMWSDELLACFSEDDLILRAVDRTYWSPRLEYFPAQTFMDKVFKPSALRRDAETLPEAIRVHGWPTMDELWGRYVFILLDRGEVRDAYRRGVDLDSPALNMDPDDPHYFVVADDPEDPDAAFFSVPAADLDQIRDLVGRGFMVHAYSLDAAEIEAARAAGAHLLTALELDDIALDAPAVCNPAVRPDEGCAPGHFTGP